MGLPLLDALPLARAERVLDLGCGTGALFPHVRARAAGARLLGVDRSDGMLRLAREAGESDVALMDAQELGFAPEAFDVAILFFMLFHLPDPAAALAEVSRVVRPGGRIGLTTWAESPPLPSASIWLEELDRLGAPADPRDPSTTRHEEAGDGRWLRRSLEDAGFEAVEGWTASFEHRWREHEELLALQAACGATGRRLAAAPEELRARCARRVRERLEELGSEPLLWSPEVLYTVAATPLAPGSVIAESSVEARSDPGR